MTRAFTFPGQGSQSIGMGRDLAEASPAAREVFEEVDDALGQNLSRLMWQGDAAELTLTENAQPALMAVSLAVIRVLEREGGLDLGRHAAFVAGHSLGEYSALTAAGALGLAEAARLLRARGRAMQEAVPVGVGAMAALLGVERAEVEAIVAEAAEGQCLALANDNAPGQIVVSGDKDAVERAVALAKAAKKKAMALPVSAPFHCPLMQPAADAMAEALAGVAIAPPRVPLVANVTAEPVSDPETIRRLLVQQVTGEVRWRDSVGRMVADGVDTVAEFGAGKVLTGMARRINPDLATVAAGTPAEIEAFARTL
jgi:[acyl-carrier-protein] S-malonyltransferase